MASGQHSTLLIRVQYANENLVNCPCSRKRNVQLPMIKHGTSKINANRIEGLALCFVDCQAIRHVYRELPSFSTNGRFDVLLLTKSTRGINIRWFDSWPSN